METSRTLKLNLAVDSPPRGTSWQSTVHRTLRPMAYGGFHPLRRFPASSRSTGLKHVRYAINACTQVYELIWRRKEEGKERDKMKKRNDRHKSKRGRTSVSHSKRAHVTDNAQRRKDTTRVPQKSPKQALRSTHRTLTKYHSHALRAQLHCTTHTPHKLPAKKSWSNVV